VPFEGPQGEQMVSMRINMWRRGKTSQPAGKLGRAAVAGETDRFSSKDLVGLPTPVVRYFQEVIREGRPLVRSARIVQEGEMRMREEDDHWSPFDATEDYSVSPPGFVWNATIRMGLVMRVRVRDSYLAGEGSIRGKVYSVIPVVNERGKPELNLGALQRYLAEAVWFPTALLPRAGVKWQEIDDRRALATLSDCGISASMEFGFNERGEVAYVFTPGRYREVGGKFELTPWEVRCDKYEERDGFRIPSEAEVAWRPPGASFVWWRGRVVDVAYDPADEDIRRENGGIVEGSDRDRD